MVFWNINEYVLFFSYFDIIKFATSNKSNSIEYKISLRLDIKFLIALIISKFLEIIYERPNYYVTNISFLTFKIFAYLNWYKDNN